MEFRHEIRIVVYMKTKTSKMVMKMNSRIKIKKQTAIMACTCCRKEIPHGKTPLKYENSLFDGLYCLNVFKKLKAVYGDWVPDL